MALQACEHAFGAYQDNRCIKIDLVDTSAAFNLSESLASNQYVLKLDLSSSGLTAAVAKILGKSLGQNAVITSVNLSHNVRLGGQGVAAILRHGGPSLTELVCSACGVHDAGCTFVSEALSKNAHLLRLSLSSNGITARGANILATGPVPDDQPQLRSSAGGLAANQALVGLDLDHNPLGGLGVGFVIQHATQPLSLLNCSHCDVADLGIPLVAEGLESSPPNLSTLCLRGNDFSAVGSERLGEALARNTSVSVLDVGFNPGFGSQGIASLVRQASVSLRELHCAGCDVGYDDVGPIAEALKSNYYLTHLVADGAEGSPRIWPALRRNAQVRHEAPWSDNLDALQDSKALLTMLRSAGDNCPNGDVQKLQCELRNRIVQSGANDNMTLLQAVAHCAKCRLVDLLPPTSESKVMAMNLVDRHLAKPLCAVDGLPKLWAHARLEPLLGSQLQPPCCRGAVLVLAPKFGLHDNPARVECLHRYGWHVHECHVPSPEDPRFDRQAAAKEVLHLVEEHRPRAIITASQTSYYCLELWQPHQACSLPVVMINVHPKLLKMPPEVAVVCCHGSRDSMFPWTPEQADVLMKSSHPKRHMLYYACARDWMPSESHHRQGDGHDMASLLDLSFLNQLLEAVIATSEAAEPIPPEVYVTDSWNRLLSGRRCAAERVFGYTPLTLLRFWKNHALANFKDSDEGDLFEVVAGSAEFEAVTDIFMELPLELSTNTSGSPPNWSNMRVTRVQRIQEPEPRWKNIRLNFYTVQTELHMQGVPGNHAEPARWLFRVPIADLDSHWRCYARDGYRAAESSGASLLPSGEMQVTLCLVMTGISCLSRPGPALHDTGSVLPFRVPRHRYNSAVNSMSNPEFFLVEGNEQAMPAYVITFSEMSAPPAV